jgi:RNA polymerase sigma factor (sigma-70 family)
MTEPGTNPDISRSVHQTERALLGRVAAGDRPAFEELYYLYHRRLVSFLFRLTRRPDLIEEILNDTMLVVWQKAGEFRNDSRPSTWIFGIAYRRTMKSLRRKDREQGELPQDMPASVNDGPELVVARKQIQTMLQEALDKLSAEQRAVVQLTYFHGYSYSEIATITGCPVNTVKTRMFHAIRRLKKLLPKLKHDFAAGTEKGRWY